MPDKIKLPALEDYKAPWEVSGEEIDPAKVKKFLHSLLGQVENKEAAEADLKTKLAAATAGREAAELLAGNLEKRLNTAGENDSEELKKAKERNAELQKQIDTFDVKNDPAYIRLEVANEKGLDAFESARLVGTTREEMQADAEEWLKRRPEPTTEKTDEEKAAEEAAELRGGPASVKGKAPLAGGDAAVSENEWTAAELAQLKNESPFQAF